MHATLLLPLAAYLTASLANALACPGDDGATSMVNGRRFHVQCNTDRPQGDVNTYITRESLIWVSSLDECVAACASHKACRGAVWSPGTPGPCYFKGELNEGVYSPEGLISVTQPRWECPEIDGMQFGLNYDSVYTVECGKDRIGREIFGSPVYVPDFEHCLKACEMTGECRTVSWKEPEPGVRRNTPCYLHGSVEPTSDDSTIWSATRSTVCPEKHGSIYTNSCGATFRVNCYKDRTGQPLENPGAGRDFYFCAQRCSLNPQCVSFQWKVGYSDKFSAVNGWCYLKGELGEESDNTGIWGADLVAGCTHEYLPNPGGYYPPGWPEMEW